MHAHGRHAWPHAYAAPVRAVHARGQANASLARAYRLFRTMGLHHLYIGPPKPLVLGVITRKARPALHALGYRARPPLCLTRAAAQTPRLCLCSARSARQRPTMAGWEGACTCMHARQLKHDASP